MGGVCGSSADGGFVDDAEVRLLGRHVADSEVNWKAGQQQLATVTEEDHTSGCSPVTDTNTKGELGIACETEDHSPANAKKAAIVQVVRSFVRGCTVEVSSTSLGSSTCFAQLDRELTELRLQAEGRESDAVKIVPLVKVLDASMEVPPGAGRYNFGACRARLRLGPHGKHGPEVLLIQLSCLEQCEAFASCIRASARHLQLQAAWQRERAMDEESVPSTVVRAVGLLRDPSGVSALLKPAAKKPKQLQSLRLPGSSREERAPQEETKREPRTDPAIPWEIQSSKFN